MTERGAIGLALGLILGCGGGGGGDHDAPLEPTATVSATVSATPSAVVTPTPQPTGPVAFAVSNRQVVRSDDGGHTWSLLLTVDETIVLQGVAFADRDHGWVVGGSDFGYGAALLRTEDGGATWTDQLPNVTGLIGAPPRNFSFSAVAATSPMHAVAVGADQQQVAVFQPPPLVAVTDDGGASWRAAPIQRLSNRGGTLRAVCLNGSGTGIAVGNGYIGTGLVFITADDGATWTENAAVENLDQGELTRMTGAACAEPAAFWISGTNIGPPLSGGYRPTLLYSAFMGEAWLNRIPRRSTARGPDELPVVFIDSDSGWAVTSPLIHRTEDAGVTWKSSSLPDAVMPAYPAVAFLQGHGIVVGSGPGAPSALTTSDGGVTWTAGVFPPAILPSSLVDVAIVP